MGHKRFKRGFDFYHTSSDKGIKTPCRTETESLGVWRFRGYASLLQQLLFMAVYYNGFMTLYDSLWQQLTSCQLTATADLCQLTTTADAMPGYCNLQLLLTKQHTTS